MRVGILSESKDDTAIIKELVIKIASEFVEPAQLEHISFVTHETGTFVIPKMSLATALFFNSRQRVDFAVFGVDLDGKKSRKLNVRKFVTDTLQLDVTIKIIPLFIEPHIEELFFSEGGNAIKGVLVDIKADEALPYSDMEPKNRLRKLIKEFGPKDLSSTRTEIYQQIARKLRIDFLGQNNKDFKVFLQDMRHTINTFYRGT